MVKVKDIIHENGKFWVLKQNGVWDLLDVAEVAEDLSVGVTQLLIDKVGE